MSTQDSAELTQAIHELSDTVKREARTTRRVLIVLFLVGIYGAFFLTAPDLAVWLGLGAIAVGFAAMMILALGGTLGMSTAKAVNFVQTRRAMSRMPDPHHDR